MRPGLNPLLTHPWRARRRDSAGIALYAERVEAERAAQAVTVRVSVGLFVAATAAITLLVALLGGAPNTWVHVYYLPILYVAVRHGARAAGAAGIVAGLAVGPWMPSSAVNEEHQPLGSWMVRLAFFALVGIVAAILAKSQSRSIDVLARDFYIAQGLRTALKLDQIHVHYQPLIDLTEGEVIGFEALCRWRDSKGRSIPPDRFIPEAERTGVITAVGGRVLHQAVGQAKAWADDGRTGLLVTVNVSAVQLSDPAFLADLIDVVRDDATASFTLCLEITETAIIADPVRALETLRAARELGVTIALDDFGTGLSSLAYLADFPIDIIKIDKSFVATIGTDPKSHALVRAMVQMAHSLGALTIAEGIEKPEQLKALRALGCAIGQGYYLGRPAEADATEWTAREVLPANGDDAGASS